MKEHKEKRNVRVHLHARFGNILHIHFIHIKEPAQLNVISQTLGFIYTYTVQIIHGSSAAVYLRKPLV